MGNTNPIQQLKSYCGQVTSGGNPGFLTQRSADSGGALGPLGVFPVDIGAPGVEASIYSYLFRNPNAAAVYVNIYNVPAGDVVLGVTVPIGRIMVAGTSNLPNQIFGPNLLLPYYYGGGGLSFQCSTVDADGAANNPPGKPIYYELTWA